MTTDRRVEWSYVEHVPPAQYHPREHADLEASSLQFDNFSNSINSAIFTKIHAKIMFWIVLKHVFQHFQAIFFLIFTKVDSVLLFSEIEGLAEFSGAVGEVVEFVGSEW